LLERHGYIVVTARDGVEAMEKLLELVPDVMLVDIEMPRMDGFDLTRNVRADKRLARVPIIMITSRTADKHQNYAKEIGVSHFLGKPTRKTISSRRSPGFSRSAGPPPENRALIRLCAQARARPRRGITIRARRHGPGQSHQPFPDRHAQHGRSVFLRTLTFICEHNEQGALGVVVNRPIEMTLGALFDRLSCG